MCQSVKLLSFIQKLFKCDSWIANKETISSAHLRGVVIYSPSMFVCVCLAASRFSPLCLVNECAVNKSHHQSNKLHHKIPTKHNNFYIFLSNTLELPG